LEPTAPSQGQVAAIDIRWQVPAVSLEPALDRGAMSPPPA